MPDETPNPLLVVRCGINLDRTNDPWVAPDDPDPTLPALAVPDALWSDPGFIAAVWQRVTDSVGVAPADALMVLETLVLGETVAAIAAELRARAVVP